MLYLCSPFTLCLSLTLLSLLTLLLIVVLFVHVYSSLVVARHSSSLVTCLRSSLVVARHSSSLPRRLSLAVALSFGYRSFSTRHLTVSLFSLYSLFLVDCRSWHFVHHPPSPSRHSSPSASHPFPHSVTGTVQSYW